MEFKKFNSLENTYRQATIDKIVNNGLGDGRWVVTEKVHGANFSFWCDGNEVKVASRTQFVDGSFYRCTEVIERYKDKIMTLWGILSSVDPAVVVVVYGELYGKGVQKEVQYGEKDFIAFDITVSGTPLNKINAHSYAHICEIPFVPILCEGTLEGCLQVSDNFRSYLTPKGYEGDNAAEGVVIEPVEPRYFGNGKRVYLKNKCAAFSEKKHREPKQVKVLPYELQELLADMLCYNTTQRVDNVVSKIGEVTNKDFGKILGLTMQDMLEDFEYDMGKNPKDICGDNWKDFNHTLKGWVSKTVREVFLKNLEEV